MKKILGLDLGPNSIGWAIVNKAEDKQENASDNNNEKSSIEACGSRIIPMNAEQLDNFGKGVKVSATAERTLFRGTRRRYERGHLRRSRLNVVLSILGLLPDHYLNKLDSHGNFIDDSEPKLAWNNKDGIPTFMFEDSFNAMIADFSKTQPELVANGKKVPYDWTIYYLRQKAVTGQISKFELGWILLNSLQKRGYYQLRDEEDGKEENENEKKEYIVATVTKVEVEDPSRNQGTDRWYKVHLDNGMVYPRKSKTELNWEGRQIELIVTTKLDDKGNAKIDKEGNISRSFKMPSEDDWTLIKLKTEQDVKDSKEYIGSFIYNTLLNKPNQKVRGKLIATIDRKFYKEELTHILHEQSKYYSELCDKTMLDKCLKALYPNNEAHRNFRSASSLIRFIIDDVIYYQRPLKSKKSEIANCQYETHKVIINGKETPQAGVKCIAKSNPIFQEFRLLQFIQNLKIKKIKDESVNKTEFDVDVTDQYIGCNEQRNKLYEFLNEKKEIDSEALLKYFGLNANEYKTNLVDNKKSPCNETRTTITNAITKVINNSLKSFDIKFTKKNKPSFTLSKEYEIALWHLLYSIESKEELEKALRSFIKHQGNDFIKGFSLGCLNMEQQKEFIAKFSTEFVAVFKDVKRFKKEYGSYSEKAIKKLLPFMRFSNISEKDFLDELPAGTNDRINKIINGEYDESIDDNTREKFVNCKQLLDFRGISTWLACYAVYGRHSEAATIAYWHKPEDIDNYLKSFKQHSLRNPVVEKVVLETLRVVRDIIKEYGKIDEIHIELGRELKKTADERAKLTKQITENENVNLRIKALLCELENDPKIAKVHHDSPSCQDRLKIYEEMGDLTNYEKRGEIEEIRKKFQKTKEEDRPTRNDIIRYKAWLDENRISPYTGRVISLSKLFSTEYEVDHIIPRSRYYDDSLSNKVICEAEVNLAKGNKLGLEFILDQGGKTVTLSGGEEVAIYTEAQYKELVERNFKSDSRKQRNLLRTEIPSNFTSQQLNNTRYIAKLLMALLSNVVREKNETAANSKNVIPCVGSITDALKKDWGLGKAWAQLMLPRFERMENLPENTFKFTTVRDGHKIPSVPLEYQKGFSIKRIDHRHHAMDAIVIACADRNIVQYLNNDSAHETDKRRDLRNSVCYKKYDDNDKENYNWVVKKPWDSFTEDVKESLSSIVPSIKKNLRILSKARNKYQRYENGKKVIVSQKNTSSVYRKPLHKASVYGNINVRKKRTVKLDYALLNINRIVNKEFKHQLRILVDKGFNIDSIKKYFEKNKDIWSDINLNKIEIYYYSNEYGDKCFAKREALSPSYSKEYIEKHIADTGIAKILINYLKAKGNNAELAFSSEGIDELNANIKKYNTREIINDDGEQTIIEVDHKPIYNVRRYEESDKYAIGRKGSKGKKYVEAATGTNLFFAIYENEIIDEVSGEKTTQRSFATIPYRIAVEQAKKGNKIAPLDANGKMPKYIISPNDLVYLPTAEEVSSETINEPLDLSRIYKMVSSQDYQCFFIQSNIAKCIVDKQEFTRLNKMERALNDEMIKQTCIPIEIDRLGNIKLKK